MQSEWKQRGFSPQLPLCPGTAQTAEQRQVAPPAEEQSAELATDTEMLQQLQEWHQWQVPCLWTELQELPQVGV